MGSLFSVRAFRSKRRERRAQAACVYVDAAKSGARSAFSVRRSNLGGWYRLFPVPFVPELMKSADRPDGGKQ